MIWGRVVLEKDLRTHMIMCVTTRLSLENVDENRVQIHQSQAVRKRILTMFDNKYRILGFSNTKSNTEEQFMFREDITIKQAPKCNVLDVQSAAILID